MELLKVYRDNGKVDISLINEFERKMKIKFPSSYKHLISNHNFLRLENDIFDYVDLDGEINDRDICFLGYGEVNPYNIYSKLELFPFYDDMKGIVPFGVSGNGDYICFDYRFLEVDEEPKVVLIYHDDYIQDADGTMNPVVNLVAKNFEEFIELLHD
ncbi:SMI1/KNR4 family protein [Testudinibacter sp. P80/BLE/0925]|uniref:SMI1/KNR4 family protein n=1 Tax=Testudinibacter sp. TW-1 TaxID=3417757 RepID=UPI003D36265F